MKKHARVLFLCTGNSCRSQMAEAFASRLSNNTIETFSAGLEPRSIHELTIEVMDEIGIDIRSQRSKSISEFLGKKSFDYGIFVCEKAEKSCPHVYPFVLNRMSWPFPDPAVAQGSKEERLAVFRNIRDAVEAKVRAWISTFDNKDNQ